jgi:hypothetical protein
MFLDILACFFLGFDMGFDMVVWVSEGGGGVTWGLKLGAVLQDFVKPLRFRVFILNVG